MDSRRRYFLIFVLVLALIPAGYGVYRFYFSSFSHPEQDEEIPQISHYIDSFRLVETPSSGETWIISAPRAERENMIIRLVEPDLIYKMDGDTIARASAHRGLYSEYDDILELEGNVEVQQDNPPRKLETEKLTWRRRDGILESDSHVKFTDERGDFEAVGLYWDIPAERVEFQSDIQMHWH